MMIGAGRDVRGGVSSVVNSYYEAGLDKLCELTYLPTMKDGNKLYKLLVAFGARLRFETLIKQVDILHVHMSADNSFYRKAVFIRKAYKERKKIIIHMHGSTFDLFYKERCNDEQKRQVMEIFAMADKVIALSEDWKEFLAEYICDAEKIEVIYNAVKIPEPYGKDYSNQKMLFLGILGQRKGTYDLIEVLPEIFQNYPDSHVYFGGDGEQKQAEQLCREKGITEHVTFLGWVRGAEKEKLLKEYGLHTIIRLPQVFKPYASVNTNLLFFKKGVVSRGVWFYRLDYPEGVKSFSKTKPMQDKHFDPVREWWENKEAIVVDGFDKARFYTPEELETLNYDFDKCCPFPHVEEEILEPKDLIARYEAERTELNASIDCILASITAKLEENK